MVRDKFWLRNKKGTPEWLVDKWTKKIYKSYRLYGEREEQILPSFLRREFITDVKLCLEEEIAELFPEKSLKKSAGKKNEQKD